MNTSRLFGNMAALLFFLIEMIIFDNCLLFAWPSLPPSSTLSDKEKLQKIVKMYDDIKKSFEDIPVLDPEDLVELQKRQAVVIVDVREEKERNVSVIPGAISEEEFEHNVSHYRDRTIVTYCTIGYRSAIYTRKLRQQNLHAFNLKGSILAWVHAGQKVVNPEGLDTHQVHVYGRKWNLLPEGYEAVF